MLNVCVIPDIRLILMIVLLIPSELDGAHRSFRELDIVALKGTLATRFQIGTSANYI